MDILNAYRAIAAKHGLPLMHAGGYRPHNDPIATPDEAWNRLASLGPRQGWLLFQSAQMLFVESLPERNPAWGVLLAAEGYTEHGGTPLSIAMEQDGRGGWNLTTYTHLGEGEFLYDELEQLAHNQGRDGPGRLKYRRYWRHDPRQGYLQAAACFIGFN